MTKRRVRLGIGLDRRKLADTVEQAFDSFAEMPGLSLDAHTEDGWLHLFPKAGFDAQGEMTSVIGWLLTFGYQHEVEPGEALAAQAISLAEGVRLAGWESGLYASFWLPPTMAPDEIAGLAIALVRRVQGVPDDSQVEVALEFGL